MIEILTADFKIALLVLGIVATLSLIWAFVSIPYKNKKREERANAMAKAFTDAMDKAVEEAIREVQEEREAKAKKKTTKKTTKSKEN